MQQRLHMPKGADVAINYLPSEEQDAQEVKAVIEKAGRKAVLIPGDIRDEQFNYDLVEQAYKELGGFRQCNISSRPSTVSR